MIWLSYIQTQKHITHTSLEKTALWAFFYFQTSFWIYLQRHKIVQKLPFLVFVEFNNNFSLLFTMNKDSKMLLLLLKTHFYFIINNNILLYIIYKLSLVKYNNIDNILLLLLMMHFYFIINNNNNIILTFIHLQE